MGRSVYWLVDLRSQTVEVYVLEQGIYVLYDEYRGDALVQSPLFPNLDVTAIELFRWQW